MAQQLITVIRRREDIEIPEEVAARMIGKYFGVFKDKKYTDDLYCLVHIPTRYIVTWCRYSATATLFAKTSMKHVKRKHLKSECRAIVGKAFPESLREWIRVNRKEKHTEVPRYVGKPEKS